MGRRPRDPRSVLRGRLVGGGRRHSRRPASVLQGPVPGWSASGASMLSRASMSGGRLAGWLACWLFGWPVTLLGISALGGPRVVRSAAGSGASFHCGGPPASSVSSTVDSLRCGWAGGAGGVGAHGAERSLVPGAGGVSRGSSKCLCGRAVRRRVCGARRRSDWRAVVRVGLRAGPCRGSWPLAGG